MNKKFWLSFDLGVQGDYNHMYAWLDNHKAVECGDSNAFVEYSVPNTMTVDEFLAYLKNDLENSISFRPGDRIYVIVYVERKKNTMGRFIIGKRKASPWEGYGDNDDDDSSDEA